MFMFLFCRRGKQVEASVCVVGLLPSWVVGRLVVGGEGGGGDLLSKQTGEHSMYEYKKMFYVLFICVFLSEFCISAVCVFFLEERPHIKTERSNHINN